MWGSRVCQGGKAVVYSTDVHTVMDRKCHWGPSVGSNKLVNGDTALAMDGVSFSLSWNCYLTFTYVCMPAVCTIHVHVYYAILLYMAFLLNKHICQEYPACSEGFRTFFNHLPFLKYSSPHFVSEWQKLLFLPIRMVLNGLVSITQLSFWTQFFVLLKLSTQLMAILLSTMIRHTKWTVINFIVI